MVRSLVQGLAKACDQALPLREDVDSLRIFQRLLEKATSNVSPRGPVPLHPNV